MDRSINLASTLLLMIDFDDVPYSFSGRQRLQWDTGTLKTCLQAYFNDPPVLGHEGVKFQRVFHAMNLERIAGVQVIPTNNLLDHLRLTHDDTRLHVFNHISFLGFKPPSKPCHDPHAPYLFMLTKTAPCCRRPWLREEFARSRCFYHLMTLQRTSIIGKWPWTRPAMVKSSVLDFLLPTIDKSKSSFIGMTDL